MGVRLSLQRRFLAIGGLSVSGSREGVRVNNKTPIAMALP